MVTRQTRDRLRRQEHPQPPVGAQRSGGVCWFHFGAPGNVMGRILIWCKRGSVWKLELVAAASNAVRQEGQWGLYRAWGSASDCGHVWRELGAYQGVVVGPPFDSDVEALIWMQQYVGWEAEHLLLCRRAGRWRLVDGRNGAGLHLHLMNDPAGTGAGSANAAFQPSGMIVVEGRVGVYDLGRDDHDVVNAQAELLIDYGPYFQLGASTVEIEAVKCVAQQRGVVTSGWS